MHRRHPEAIWQCLRFHQFWLWPTGPPGAWPDPVLREQSAQETEGHSKDRSLYRVGNLRSVILLLEK